MGKARQRRRARQSQSSRRFFSRLLPIGASERTKAKFASLRFRSALSGGYVL